jgi:uncharacterized membrane protein
MKKNSWKKRLAVCLVLSIFLLGPSPVAFSDSTTITTIDVLVPGTNNLTFPQSINAQGTIAGFYLAFTSTFPFPTITRHGFVRDKLGNITTFDAPGAGTGLPRGTTALSINNEGAIVGFYSGFDNRQHAFVRDKDGNITTFDAPGAYDTAAGSINGEGAIAGYYFDFNSARFGFVRDKHGNFTTFSAPGYYITPDPYPYSGRLGINEEGAIAGSTNDVIYSSQGFVRDEDGNITTFTAPSAFVTEATSINEEGAIAGTSTDINGVHGFVRDRHGNFTTFDGPGAYTAYGTFAMSINEDGVVVGFYFDAGGQTHGFVRNRHGNITSLNLGPNAVALNINEEGSVVGSYLGHGFVLTGE